MISAGKLRDRKGGCRGSYQDVRRCPFSLDRVLSCHIGSFILLPACADMRIVVFAALPRSGVSNTARQTRLFRGRALADHPTQPRMY